MMEAHIFLLTTLKDFEFYYPDDNGSGVCEYEEDLLLRPKNKMPLKVRKRELKDLTV